ncbi:MAG: Epoxyqueuosine reductase [Dehalococcoidia bacterium]|nr:Epoxyqueuosine reductase [Bacillota bacterium]
MSVGKEILEKACTLFDVAGAAVLSDRENLLILGLESTAERNLDEFGRKVGKFMLYGFKKHAAPKLESLVNFIRSNGFSAETVKRYGYPLKGEIGLKREAIRAGLGKRGKSTVVLHPKYGPRLRFMVIRTTAPLESAVTSTPAETENPVCQDCSICLEVCPTRVLEPYRMTNPLLCLSNITPQTEDGHSILCDKCLIMCPPGEN